MNRKNLLIMAACVVLLLLAGSIWYIVARKSSTESPAAVASITSPTQEKKEIEQPAATTPTTPTSTPEPNPPATTWPVLLSMTEAAEITVDVNKKHKLPEAYVPAGLTSYGGISLRSEAAAAIANLVSAAAGSGHTLKMISGYRSYASQSTIYNNYVAQDGQAAADTYSARPGFSEHQTGLAVDVGNGICDLEICFGDTAAGKWVATNAQNYGFIVRYPQGKEAETGYQYEPWHLRYLGIDNAKSIYASGKTMDQYYGIAAGGY